MVDDSVPLKSVPSWIAQNASLSDTTECHVSKPVVIRTKDDYDKYAANSTLVNSKTLGRVIVSWADITDSQLATILQKKTHLQELVIEDCDKLTTMSPALDALVSVDSRLVLENLKEVKSVELKSLNTTGSELLITKLPVVTSMQLPQLTKVGASLTFYNAYRTTTLSAPSLVAVNGSLVLLKLQTLAAETFATGFASLRTVGGNLQITQASQTAGINSRTPLLLPAVTSVGALIVSGSYLVSLSMPLLQTVQSQMILAQNNYIRIVDTPSLTKVGGKITLSRMPALTSLCELSLDKDDFSGGQVCC